MANWSGSTERADDAPGDTASPTPPRRRLSVANILFGSDGLRALWGILVFLALRETLDACAFPLEGALVPPSLRGNALMRPWPMLVYEGAALLCVLAASWVMAKIEQRPNTAYGLGGGRPLHHFLAGLVWGVVLLSLLVASLHAAGLLVFDGRQLFGPRALGYGAIWLAGFLLVGLFEEYLNRGYLQFTLARGFEGMFRWLHAPYANALGFWSAAFLTSFYFGFGHQSNSGESPIGLLAAGLIGMVFCLSLWRTGSLWWAIGFHAAWDWAQSFLYGVADSGSMVKGHLLATHPLGQPIFSGGLTGPEGSLFVLPVVALAAIVILVTLPRTQPDAARSGEHPS